MFPLSSLPDDIILFHLIRFLDPSDITNLASCSKRLYHVLNSPVRWHMIYSKAFGDQSDLEFPFDTFYKWGPELFKQRANAHLYTFGENSYSRLGYRFEGNTRRNYENLHFKRRMFRPTKVENLTKIMDISAGGFSFEILTMDGQLFYTGNSWHGSEFSSSPGPVHSDDFTIQYPAQGQVSKIRLLNHVDDFKIVAVSSGRAHFIALSSTGLLYTWDSRGQYSIGVRVALINPQTDREIKGRILKIRAGWSLSSCLVEKLGIVIWSRRTNVHNSQAKAYVRIVANSKEDRIADYVVLEHTLIYITTKGLLYKVDLEGVDLENPIERVNPIPSGAILSSFEDHLKQEGSSKFVRLSGCYQTFTVISDGDDVLIGKANENNYKKPIVISKLQHNSIIAVAAGDYHYLALRKDGTLYSWGRESHSNGCLGLGKLQDILDSGIGTLDESDLVVSEPHKVPIDGRVLAIAAAGWQSAAIVC